MLISIHSDPLSFIFDHPAVALARKEYILLLLIFAPIPYIVSWKKWTNKWIRTKERLFSTTQLSSFKGLPRWHNGKEPTCQCRRCKFNPWVEKIPWRRKLQPTPVFLLGNSHGQTEEPGKLQSMRLQKVRHSYTHAQRLLL